MTRRPAEVLTASRDAIVRATGPHPFAVAGFATASALCFVCAGVLWDVDPLGAAAVFVLAGVCFVVSCALGSDDE